MNIQNNINTRPINNSFSSRSKMGKDVDDVCRAVVREFPSVFSSSKLFGYESLKKCPSGPNLKYYSEGLLKLSRCNYSIPSNVDYQYSREFADMKKYKVSNCGELADVTQMALKLNGYDDAKILQLFAYDKNTDKMRNLDHCVVGLNFKLPEKYSYNVYNIQYNLSPKYRIYPQNNSLIVDSWSGKTEYAKKIKSDYNSNKALIRSVNKYRLEELPPDQTLLKDGEELCYVPVYQPFLMSKDALSYFGKKYEGLILHRNKGKVDLSGTLSEITQETIPQEKIQNLRKECEIGEYKPAIKVEERKNSSILSNIKSMLNFVAGIF